MANFRTPLIDKAQPIVFMTGPNAGCVTPYYQRTLLSISTQAGEGASASFDYGPQISTINGQITTINTSLAGKVAKSTFTTWASPTGTAARTTFATYTAPTVSASYSQAEVQAIADHVQILSQRLKALIDDLKS